MWTSLFDNKQRDCHAHRRFPVSAYYLISLIYIKYALLFQQYSIDQLFIFLCCATITNDFCQLRVVTMILILPSKTFCSTLYSSSSGEMFYSLCLIGPIDNLLGVWPVLSSASNSWSWGDGGGSSDNAGRTSRRRPFVVSSETANVGLEVRREILRGRLGDPGWSRRLKGSLLFFLDLVGIAIDEHIDFNIPRHLTGHGASHTHNLTGQQPPHQTYRVLGLVVARDGNVDITQVRIGVAEGDHGDVRVRGFFDRLVVCARIAYDKEARLLKSLLKKKMIKE